MQKIDLADLDAAPSTGPWASATKAEFTTQEGKVFRLRAAALGTADETARGWIVVLPDVTAERRAQREREEWFGFLSHDLRGPQVTILSLLGLYADGAPGYDIARVTHGIEVEANRTVELAGDFMDMVEAESGVYKFRRAYAGAIILDAVDNTWAAADARGITLLPSLGSSDCTLAADNALLTRALVNLLRNAIRYSPRGSTIRICLETDLDSALPRGEAVISVQDEGQGMTPAQVAQVLHTGERRRSSTGASRRNPEQGWGIGMAIVHAVVARHGGWVDVLSAPDAGATFLIGLPLTAADAPTEL